MSATTTRLGVDHPTVVPQDRQHDQGEDGAEDENAGGGASA